jgi:hypothetical protein
MNVLLYRAAHIDVSHDAITNILYCRWRGIQRTEGIMSAGMEILGITKTKGISRILNDNREVRGPWLNAATWASEEWFPLMQQAGLKHFAWILPRNLFAEVSAIVAMRHSKVVSTFKSYDQAHQWLLSQQ